MRSVALEEDKAGNARALGSPAVKLEPCSAVSGLRYWSAQRPLSSASSSYTQARVNRVNLAKACGESHGHKAPAQLEMC